MRDAPQARQEVAATTADGKVWVVGGLLERGASPKVDVYDPARDAWLAAPDLPVALHHAMAVTYRGEVVVIGGFLADGDLFRNASDRVLVLRGAAWVDLPRLRRPRGAGAAAVVGDSVVVAGGQDGRLIGPSEVFDGTAWRDAAPIPTLRDHLAAATDGDHLFAVGGRPLDMERNVRALERYDVVSDR